MFNVGSTDGMTDRMTNKQSQTDKLGGQTDLDGRTDRQVDRQTDKQTTILVNCVSKYRPLWRVAITIGGREWEGEGGCLQ